MANREVIGMLQKPLRPKEVASPGQADPNASIYWIIREAKDEVMRAAEERIAAVQSRADAAAELASGRIDALTAELEAERARSAGSKQEQQAIIDRVASLESTLETALGSINEALVRLAEPEKEDDSEQLTSIVTRLAGLEASLARIRPASAPAPVFPEMELEVVSRDAGGDIRQLRVKPKP